MPTPPRWPNRPRDRRAHRRRSAQPTSLAPPEASGPDAAPEDPDETVATEVIVTSGEAPVVAHGGAAGPDPGTSVTSTTASVPTTTTTAPPAGSGGLLDTLARLLGKD